MREEYTLIAIGPFYIHDSPWTKKTLRDGAFFISDDSNGLSVIIYNNLHKTAIIAISGADCFH
jgi:hypothetical protein